MKKILCLMLLLFYGVIIAQDESSLKIYESPIYEDQVKTDIVKAIYSSKDGITGVIRNDEKHIVFDIFNEHFSNIHSELIETERKETYIGDIFYNNEIIVFTESFPNKDEKVLSCFVLNLNDKSNKKVKLSSTVIDKKLSLFSNEKGAKFSMSPNENYFTIANYTIHRDEIFYHISVFDSTSYELIFDNQISRKESKFYSLSEIHIDNNKNIFLLGESFYNENSPKLKNEENRHIILEKISQDNYSLLNLELEGKHLKSVKTEINDQVMNLYGLYSESGENSTQGVSNINIDIDSFEILSTNMQELPNQVYEDLFASKKVEKIIGEELYNFKTDHILRDDLGNVYLLAERFFITYVNNRKVENYGALLIIKFNSDGQVAWGRSVDKFDYRPNYNAFIKDDLVHIVLNSGRNFKEFDDGRVVFSQGAFETSTLYNLVYDNSGEYNINRIQDNKGKTYYLPGLGVFVDNKFIMIGNSRKNRRFMTLE